MKYVKVVIDNASDHTDTFYTYACDFDSVRRGSKVRVPFGRGNRLRDAYVFEVSREGEAGLEVETSKIKRVESVEKEVSLPEDLVSVCEWMRDAYLCRYIDAVRCMIPPGVKGTGNVRKDPYEDLVCIPSEAPVLTREQENAMAQILPHIERKEHRTFLLNGVTSSGKTEIYLRTAQAAAERGRQSIVLVPEISLTPQTIERFVSRFGPENVAVLHSRLTRRQRWEQWLRVRDGRAKILIGARLGVFAPFSNLGAVIVDEEHEASYKSDMTPKYDAIDVAVKRGELNSAVVVLGTATPSVVSRFRASSGQYQELRLPVRYNRTPLPRVEIADMRKELREGNRSIFSRVLYEKSMKALSEGKQVIFFLNRRGYSSFISCRNCGFALKCETCGISMTYHKSSGMAECHYCGRRIKVPEICPSCGSRYIRHFGIGTEQVEELAAEAFPGRKIARLDLDTAKKKGDAQKILNAFHRGKTDILVGTQLVAKGLDFQNVGVVGIIAADVTLNIPDFRSAERTFQLITQAAGRCGRGDEPGDVVIQTYCPEENAVKYAAEGDYEGFYRRELMIRNLAGYPPFTNIIRLVFYDKEESTARREAQEVFFRVKENPAAQQRELFAPQPAYLNKMNENYRYQFMIKSPLEKTRKYLKIISEIKRERTERSGTKSVMLVEIDPYSMT